MHATVTLTRTVRRQALRRPGRVLESGATAGLLYRLLSTPAPLGTGIPRPDLSVGAMVALWQDQAAADEALSGPHVAFDWRVDLEPLRVIGGWPGVPTNLTTESERRHDGPTFVITIGRLRLRQAGRFFRAGSRAEKQVIASPGLTWSTGLVTPELATLATLSWWHDFDQMATIARGEGDHRRAVAQQQRKDFHHRSAFIRFRPIALTGSIDIKNPPPTSLRDE